MINITKNGNAIKFAFTDSNHYLYGDGEIDVPVNALTLIVDESNMVTFRKAASNDIFITFDPANSNLDDKAGVIDFYKTNMVGETGGGGTGSGVTSGQVQSMIDDSLTDYYDKDEVDAGFAEKQNVSGMSAYTLQSNFETHSGNTDMHTTAEEKAAWNAKQDALRFYTEDSDGLAQMYVDEDTGIQVFGDLVNIMSNNTEMSIRNSGVTINNDPVVTASQLNDYWTSAQTQNAIDAATSGTPSSQVIEQLRTDVNTLSGDVTNKYDKVSGITIELNGEDNPFIKIEKELEDGSTNYTDINDAGLNSAFENNEDGSVYSSYIGQGSLGNSATDFPDENVTSERSLNISTDGFEQTIYENYDDGETQYLRYSSENTFNYDNGLTLHQYWYDQEEDTETNSYINIVNSKEGATFIELTDTNERTVSITPNMLSWDDGEDSGGFEWSSIATLNDISGKQDASAMTEYYTSAQTESAISGALLTKQDTLVSGTNIKTINNQSLLGSGNINISGGSGSYQYYSENTTDKIASIAVENSEAGTLGAIDVASDNVNFTASITGGTEGNETEDSTSANISAYGAEVHYEKMTGSDGTDAHSYFDMNDSGISFETYNNDVTTTVEINDNGVLINNDAVVTESQLADYQPVLSAGTGIDITNNVISATGGGGATYSAGTNISIDTANTINCTLPITANTSNKNVSVGYSLNVREEGETSIGKFNVNRYESSIAHSGNTIFTVGNGGSNGLRHNALEIRKNGDLYFADTSNNSQSYYQKPMVRLQDMYGALGGLKFVKLTQAEYDALATKDSSTVYIIVSGS